MPHSKSDKGKKEKATPKSATVREDMPKKPPEPPVSSQKAAFLLESPLPWEFIAFGVLLAALFIVQESTIKYGHQLVFFAGAAIIFIFSYIFRINRELLTSKLSPVFLLLLAQSLLFFAGLFYAHYPKFALQQFFLNCGALLIFASLYPFFLRNEKNYKRFLALFSGCVALFSLISIELATSRVSFNVLQALIKQFGSTLPSDFALFETNTRIITVLGNANVFAPLAALAMFSALNFTGKSGSRLRSDAVFMTLALICGTAFVLCFSMGTIAMYVPALAVLIWATSKEDRGSVLFKNLYCDVASLIIASFVFILRYKSILPLIVVLVISIAFALLYIYLKPIKLPIIKLKNKKAIFLSAAGVVLVLVLAVTLLKGSYPMSKGSSFRRAVALKPGTYSLTVAANGEKVFTDLTVEISSMSFEEATLKEKTVLKTDVVNKVIEFTVPSSSAAVFFNFSSASDITVQKAVVSGAGVTKSLSLRYLMLPEFIVNRLQGIWVNDNAIQRFVFFRDGLRLAFKSPLIGLGGGAFEGGLYSVADYKYQTKHVHNEYIQNFIDGGIPGLLIFVAITFFLFRALFKAKKAKQNPQLTPLFFCAMIFIFLHSMIEVDFMMSAFRMSALAFFAITSAACGDTLETGKIPRAVPKILLPLTAVASIVLCVGRVYALDSTTSKNVNLQTIQQASTYDPFDSLDYKLSYLVNTASLSVAPAQAREYIADLEKSKIYGDGEYLLAYYHLFKNKPELDKGVKVAEDYIRQRRVDPDSWDQIFTLYEQYLNSPANKTVKNDKIYESAASLCSFLSEINASLPKPVKPALANFIYMQSAASAKYKSTRFLIDSRIDCDLDRNGTSDLILSRRTDSVDWGLNVIIQPNEIYTLRVYADSAASCEVILDGKKTACTYDTKNACFTASLVSNDKKIKNLTVRTNRYTDKSYFTLETTAS